MPGTEAYYDRTAEEWARRGYDPEATPPFLEDFLSLLPPGGRVLDLCCGAGYESGRVRGRGFEAVGLDLSGASLAIARERNPEIPFWQGDMLEDYSHIGLVDGILCIAGLVHVEARDLPVAFRRMGQALRPGGYIAATVREGTGRMEERSVTEIGGEVYDRNFIAHTLEELTGAMGEEFAYMREMASDMDIWHTYLFKKT